MIAANAAEIIAFWCEAGYERWFSRDEAFDEEIRARFLATHEAAAAGALNRWEETPEGALALLILLDQFPRNLFRGTPRAFATDALARTIADRALTKGFDQKVPPELKGFFYLPFMHSENLVDQERCVALYEAAGDEKGLPHAIEHRDIIARFGRFPHRNPILGRATTEEEAAFLANGGFSG
ncbi:hypothetical protein BOQ54_12450 [Chelatococcus daeguensis]|uniref:DUF924 domain-containing protein n=1 Tax=Chelatococcus daeguensis TaxID=444444 RepID=A0AAC9JQY3_9HYPH|nr:DUF924 family protein [Chelatococcus daeguensis]APF38039.1 hypothetical protein BOQ54_12450 [Chelatococcus daeguensis]